MTKTARERTKGKRQRGAAMKDLEGDLLLRTRSFLLSTSPDNELYREDAGDDGYYNFPMDLRKKSLMSLDYHSGDSECKETETENATIQFPIQPTACARSRQKSFLNALPFPAMEDPVLEALSLPNKESSSTGIVLDLRKEPAKSETPARGTLTNKPFKTDEDSNPALIPFLISHERSAPEQEQQQDEQPQQRWQDAATPEVFSPHSTPPPLADNHNDRDAKRTASCPKLFDETNESLLERLARVRCRSDSDTHNDSNSSSPRRHSFDAFTSPLPRDRRSPSPTLKRPAPTCIAYTDGAPTKHEESCKLPRIHEELLFHPGLRLCSTTCCSRAPQETLFPQLRQLGPATLPLSACAYDAHIMQRFLDHELLKRHLEAMAASAGLPSQLLAPAPLVSGMAPSLEALEEHDEMAPEPGNQTDLHSGGMRKRASRALTGKHVKQGTGASPVTLLTLKNKIRERQIARQLGILEPGVRTLKGDKKAKNGSGKGSSNGKKPASK